MRSVVYVKKISRKSYVEIRVMHLTLTTLAKLSQYLQYFPNDYRSYIYSNLVVCERCKKTISTKYLFYTQEFYAYHKKCLRSAFSGHIAKVTTE